MLTDMGGMNSNDLNVDVGGRVQVVSSYEGEKMLFPLPTPKSGRVCELSQHRNSDGSAYVDYVATHVGSVFFDSSLVKVTAAADPLMHGTWNISN
jgi:hypothetical protein